MAENLKRFFKKKKIDLTFKKAGPGQRLNEETKKPVARVEEPCFSRVEQSAEAKQAAAAALARLQGTSSSSAGFGKSSLYTKIKNEVSQELKSLAISSTESKKNEPVKRVENTDEGYTSPYATSGVYFRCPLIGDEILTKSEWKTKIREYLYGQLENEKGLIACLIIRNCNKNPDKINSCIETLSKYLRNIVNHPNEEKYQKIRVSNKVFQERVAGMEGALEFLEAAGFMKQQLVVHDETGPEEFLIISKEKAKDVETLETLADALHNAETITLELDRNIQVLHPSQAESRTQLPDDFFRYTPEELKKEQQARTEIVDSMLSLRTKAMREKQEQREMKKYRYALIRVRFPDSILLQGTFSVHEKYEEVHKFVEENLNVNCDFSLVMAEIGRSFSREDFDKTLLELHLVPATVLLFHSNSSKTTDESLSYLKPSTAVLLQSL